MNMSSLPRFEEKFDSMEGMTLHLTSEFKEHEKAVSILNNMGLTWKAKV